jgi:hypothetical protein
MESVFFLNLYTVIHINKKVLYSMQYNIYILI